LNRLFAHHRGLYHADGQMQDEVYRDLRWLRNKGKDIDTVSS
jgi:hypothetical protein